jgi:tetratricopeptide (TPR) repeat protein/mono/diheme cytochrome c family protein
MKCAVPLAVFLAASACARTPAPTFTRDVAPILFANCVTCHRPGEVAPFSLLTFAEAQKRGVKIAKQTQARHMPPWLPEGGDVPILGERRLTDAQIATIQQWVKAGMPEGNATDLPKPPTFPDGWQLGKPDVVLTADKPYTLQPSNDDVYRNLIVKTTLSSDAFVRGVEFRTNGAPIHHAVIRVDGSRSSRRRDGADGQPGFDGMSVDSVQDPEGHFLGWAPGRGPIVAPDGMPWRLPKGADLVVELHMVPSRRSADINPTIALFFADAPPVRTPLTVKMGSRLIDIPAGERAHVVTDTYEMAAPAELMSVYPHAHYLARDMRVTVEMPDASSKTLLHIPDWSFHWQQDYRYATAVPLPRGAKIIMRYTYDNSDANEENPRHPPVRVRLGPKSTDEMAELGLQLLTATKADAATIVQSFVERDAQASVTLGETRTREEPGNAEYQAFLGSAYIEVGRPEQAIAPLEAALRLDERLAGAHSDLGTALMATGRLPEALAHFTRAVALEPRNEVVLYNLGNGLKQAGRAADAASAYQRALAANPDYADAHVNLGSLLYSSGRVREALPHFARAADLLPNSAVIQTNFGSALAASGQFRDALVRFRRALELRPDYGPALDSVARLERMGIK